MAKESSNKRNVSGAELKASTVNISMNVLIFLLGGLIIYMSYSIYVKLWGAEKSSNELIEKETPSEIIQVEVLNGCGISGVADMFTDYLRAQSFDVVNIDNYVSFDINESLVIDRIGNMSNARKIAESLNINKKNVIQQLNDDYFLDVTIIIGKDYYKLKPLK